MEFAACGDRTFTYFIVYFDCMGWFPVAESCLASLDKMYLTKVVILCLAIEIAHCLPKDAFHEELYLKHLPSGHIYAHFQFTTTWNTSLGDKNACMFDLKSSKLRPFCADNEITG